MKSKPILAGTLLYFAATASALAGAQASTQEGAPARESQQMQPGDMPTPRPGKEDEIATETVSTDTLVQMVALNDIFEVELSKLALQKSNNSNVQAYASRLIKDHTASTERLAAILKAESINIGLPTHIDPDHDKIIKSLQGLAGSEFDSGFARAQQQAHENILPVLTRYRDSGRDKSLQAFAADTVKIIERHLAESKKLERASM